MTVKDVMSETGLNYNQAYNKYFRKKKNAESKPDVRQGIDTKVETVDPLEYMLKIINDPNIEPARRDRMAIAAAPFVHARADGKKGKREEQEEAARKAAKGKFAHGRVPVLPLRRN